MNKIEILPICEDFIFLIYSEILIGNSYLQYVKIAIVNLYDQSSIYYTAIQSLYQNMVVSCKAKRERNQLWAWLDSDQKTK